MSKTTIYVVIGAFGGVIDEVVVEADEAAAQAHYRRLCTEYGFDPAHASESEHDVKLVSLSLPLPTPGLTERQVARLAFEAVERMGDIFYEATRWGEPWICEPCDLEFDSVQGLQQDGDHRPLCPVCSQPLTSADQRIREAAEGGVQYAIEAALGAVGGEVSRSYAGRVSDALLDRLAAEVIAHETPEQVEEDDPLARLRREPVERLEELLATYQAEYDAYAEGRAAQGWEGYDTEEAEQDGRCQGLVWGLKHVITLLRSGRWEFAESLAMQGYVQRHSDEEVQDG